MLSESDVQAVEVVFPSFFPLRYIKSRVLLEIGPLASWIPWEKATILHQEAHRENNFPVRYSRHYYDLSQMCQSKVKTSALDQPGLLQDVVRFKRQFYPCKWAGMMQQKLIC